MRLRRPRYSIAWLMVLVGIAALDFGAIRASFGLEDPNIGNVVSLLVWGALPMLNILVVGILIGLGHRGSRRFLLGFEVFGAAALVVYIALAVRFTQEMRDIYLNVVLVPPWRITRMTVPTAIFVILWVSITVICWTLPQVSFS